MPLYGPKFPLSEGTHDTFDLYDDIKDQISFFLKNLILTSPGENISDPEYGVGLRRFLFEPNIASVHGDISAEISSQISTYLPYLSVEQVSVSASPQDIDSNSINILISYRLPDEDTLFTFDLEAESATTIGFY